MQDTFTKYIKDQTNIVIAKNPELNKLAVENGWRKFFTLVLDKDSDIYSEKIKKLEKVKNVEELAELIPTSFYSFGFKSWSKYVDRDIEASITKGNSNVKCGKCGKRNVYHTSMQTRSADEGETNIYLCLECGNKWRVN